MTDQIFAEGTLIPFRPARGRREHPTLTPAGLQHKRVLARRRALMIALNLASVTALFWGIATAFAPGGYSVSDIVIMACFLLGAPWTVMGVWNAALGVWLLHGARDGLGAVAPHLAAGETEAPVTVRVALTMTLRNEDPARPLARLAEMRRNLDETGEGGQFDIFVLSDSSDPEIAAEEERVFAALRPSLGGARATYRRRERNTGFKAGNIRDWLARWGAAYDLFLPLDSDSLMSGRTIVEMARIAEAHPRIGILQGLVVGAPALSAFARIFQFGMRHGMRSFTMGAAWWQGDCGPFWGHNAMIRVGPFRRHCRLPVLPGTGPLSGHVMSHDQIEAALMRRAGYEVRVIPVETESWEENPPTLMDFTKRDLRWCQGNMQYLKLLGLKGLRPTSRFQVIAAIMMYVGAPAWMLMTVAAASKAIIPDGGINLAVGIAMFFIMFAVSLVPKLLGMLDIALTPGGAARYGGRLRFALGGVVETVFSILMAPVVALRVTIFLAGLTVGRKVGWSGQNRDSYRLSWGDAARGLWPQTLFGGAMFAVIAVFAGLSTTVWGAPMIAGLVLSIPFAVGTAAPALGRWTARVGLCAIPDEIKPPAVLVRAPAGDAPGPSEPERRAA